MAKILVPIILLVAIAGGGGAGFFAKQMLAGDDAALDGKDAAHDGEGEHGETGDAHADKGHSENDHSEDDHSDDGKADKKHADGGHGDGGYGDEPKKKTYASDDSHGGATLPDDIGYFKFSRQFVVPIIGEGGVGALVILDLNLEMQSEAATNFYFREPKFRDALMQELLDLANEGRFEGRLTDRRNLEVIRTDLLAAVQDVAGDAVKEVLILDIMRQDL